MFPPQGTCDQGTVSGHRGPDRRRRDGTVGPRDGRDLETGQQESVVDMG